MSSKRSTNKIFRNVKTNGQVYFGNYNHTLKNAVQAHRAGKLAEAEQLYRQVLDVKSDHPDALHMMGVLAHQNGRNDVALALITEAVRVKPNNPEALGNMGIVLAALGYPEAAIESFQSAIALKPDSAKAHWNLGGALTDARLYADAIKHFQKAISLQPNYADAYNKLGNVYYLLREYLSAIEGYEKAIEIEPKHFDARFSMAKALTDSDRIEEAVVAYQNILKIRPNHPDAYWFLGDLYRQSYKLADASDAYLKALGLQPGHPGATIGLATLKRRDGRADEALDMLEALERDGLSGEDAYDLNFQIGKLYDEKGMAAEAFDRFSKANALQAASSGLRVAELSDKYHTFMRKTSTSLTPDLAAKLGAHPLAETDEVPIFLVGFPRSGTTLLDQILGAHPRLQIAEEKAALFDIFTQVNAMEKGFPDALSSLSVQAVDEMRTFYWEKMNVYVDRQPDELLVDKLPLNITRMALIAHIFPGAKILLALRHPCDVILSCFMQSFELNDAMMNFLTLADSVAFYKTVMELWLQSVDRLNLNVYTSKYEALVADQEGTTRGVLDFLKLDWDDSVLDHVSYSRKLGRISTPSYEQVTQPIYTKAVDRWRRYEKYLAPYLEDLAPLAEAFGYDVSPSA